MIEDIKINHDHVIGAKSPVFIIAEIGQNHQGSIEEAKRLIQTAKDCGVDCVKFQKTELLEKFTRSALKRPYLNRNSFGRTYGLHKKCLEFTHNEFVELKQYADSIGIIFSATPMDCQSLEFLLKLNLPFIKIGSGDANNPILIRKAAESNLPLLISTGMQNFDTVQQIYQTVSEYHKHFVLLHCVSSYPTPIKEINLEVINLYKREFPDISIGYSGHELGIHTSLAAAAMGAKVIERHLTLNKQQKGSDHCSSLEPHEFRSLVQSIRNLELAMGRPIKVRQQSEYSCYQKLGKSIVASRDLKRGTLLKLEDLKIKVSEPKGIDGEKIYTIIGKLLSRDIEQDQPIIAYDFL